MPFSQILSTWLCDLLLVLVLLFGIALGNALVRGVEGVHAGSLMGNQTKWHEIEKYYLD